MWDLLMNTSWKTKFYAALAEKLYAVLAPLTPPLSFHLQVESVWWHKTNLGGDSRIFLSESLRPWLEILPRKLSFKIVSFVQNQIIIVALFCILLDFVLYQVI